MSLVAVSGEEYSNSTVEDLVSKGFQYGLYAYSDYDNDSQIIKFGQIELSSKEYIGFSLKDACQKRVNGQQGQSFSSTASHIISKCWASQYPDTKVHGQLKAYFIRYDKSTGGKSEWFQCTLSDIDNAIDCINNGKQYSNHSELHLRSLQQSFIDKIGHYDFSKGRWFLCGACCRFGKTTANLYTALKVFNKKHILVITYRPTDVRESWEHDLQEFFEELSPKYFSTSSKSKKDITDEMKSLDYSKVELVMTSFQLLSKNSSICDTMKDKFDYILIDEDQIGGWNANSKTLLENYFPNIPTIVLTGTPYKERESGEFTENNSFISTYLDQLKKKEEGDPDYKKCPYPNIFGFDKVNLENQNLDIDKSLKKFFSTTGNRETSIFKDQNRINKWVSLLFSDKSFLQEDEKYDFYMAYDIFNKYPLINGVWALPNDNACFAMEKFLNKLLCNQKYKVIRLVEKNVNYNELCLEIKKDNHNGYRTICLTCRKALVAVTVNPWNYIFLLSGSEYSNRDTWEQSIYRPSSGYNFESNNDFTCDKEYKDNETYYKGRFFVFDFAPFRHLAMIYSIAVESSKHTGKRIEESLKEVFDYYSLYNINGKTIEQLNYKDVISDIAFNKDISERVCQSTFNDQNLRKFYSDDLSKKMNNDTNTISSNNDKNSSGKVDTHDDSILLDDTDKKSTFQIYKENLAKIVHSMFGNAYVLCKFNLTFDSIKEFFNTDHLTSELELLLDSNFLRDYNSRVLKKNYRDTLWRYAQPIKFELENNIRFKEHITLLCSSYMSKGKTEEGKKEIFKEAYVKYSDYIYNPLFEKMLNESGATENSVIFNPWSPSGLEFFDIKKKFPLYNGNNYAVIAIGTISAMMNSWSIFGDLDYKNHKNIIIYDDTSSSLDGKKFLDFLEKQKENVHVILNTMTDLFDAIIMNPPYNGNLHLQILEKVLAFKKDNGTCVCLHPIDKLISPKLIYNPYSIMEFKTLENTLRKCISCEEIKNANSYFNIHNLSQIGITTWSNNYFRKDIDTFVNFSENEKNIIKKIMLKIEKNNCFQFVHNNRDGNIIQYIPAIHGNLAENGYSKDFYEIFSLDYNNACAVEKPTNASEAAKIIFDSEQERKNFIESTHLQVHKKIMTFWKTDMKIRLKFIPWLDDYTEPWTNEKLCNYFGLTKEESEFMYKKV